MSNLDEFNPAEDLPPDFMMIMYGMRRTGKTTALLTMLEMMQERFEKHKVFVFTGTGKDKPEQWKNFPLNAVKTDIANIDRSIGEIIEDQRAAIKEEVVKQMNQKRANPNKDGCDGLDTLRQGEESKGRGKKGKKRKRVKDGANGAIPQEAEKGPDNDLERFPGQIHKSLEDSKSLTEYDLMEVRRQGLIDETTLPHILVILDDVVNEGAIRHSPNLNALAVHGRHLFITAIILSQCVCGSSSVPPAIRINSDFVLVVGNPRSKRERDLLQEQYLTISNERASANEGLHLLEKVTTQVKYRILAINVASSCATRFNEYLYTFGPVPEPPDNVSPGFKMGTEEQWKKDKELKRKPQFTDKDFLKDPPKGPDLQAIDSGRFGVGNRSGVPGDTHVSKGIERFVSRHPEFLDPYF
jgi:hypothetical protein